MTLGERIQSYRKKNGLSQEQLAEALGVSRQAVSKWELNDAQPDLDKVLALAGCFRSPRIPYWVMSPLSRRRRLPSRRGQSGPNVSAGTYPVGGGAVSDGAGLMSLATIYSFLRMTEQITQQMGPF